MAITFKGNGATMIKVLDLGLPGAQGVQGDPGASADEPLQWTLSIATDVTDVYPVGGQVKLYDQIAFQVAISETTSAGGKVGGWLTSLRSIYMGNIGMTMAVVSVADPNTYALCSVVSVSPLYETNGTFSTIVTSTVLEQSGEFGEGDTIEVVFFRLGADGPQGYQGEFGPQGPQSALPGAQGPRGYQGLTGITGLPGDLGHQGPQGTQGASTRGPQGLIGSIGEEGPQGPQGNQGLPGDQGYQGFSGTEGVVGPQGVQGVGPQGPQGYQGDPGGPQGPQGYPGERGSQGPQGSTGPSGQRGVQGVQGDPGPQGPQGNQGGSGVVGPQGYEGPQGVQGEPGNSGNAGGQGAQGYQGDRGLGFVISKIYNSDAERSSATGGNLPGNGEFGLVAGSLDHNHADYGKLYLYTTLGGWSLKTDMSVSGYQGLSGAQGSQGPVGSQGSQGTPTTGPQGYQGSQGVQGDPGYRGYQGPTVGYRGNQGSQGVQGASGASIYAAAGTGLIYVSNNASETLSIGTGLSTDGTSGTRVLYVSGAKSRPALDANHIHVYNCDETSGTTLTDSGSGAKNMTLLGTSGTNYSLGSYGTGRVTRSARFLQDANSSTGARTAATCSITGGKVTLECVAMMTEAPGANRGLVTVDASSDGTLNDALYITANASGYWYAGLRIGGGAWQETGLSSSKICYGISQHLMVIYDPTASPTLKFYVDGVLVTSGSASGTLPTMTRVTIANLGGLGAWSAKCHIRDVRVSNIARAASYALSSANALLSL